MHKMIIATPNEEMFAQATEVIESAGLNAKALLVSSQNVLQIVQEERARGASVVVARGNHAHLIKKHTDMPLIEIVFSGQDLALLIEQAVALSGKERPKVALIGFSKMFSDPEPFARILGADVEIYYANSTEAIPETVDRAHEDGADVVVGGEIALRRASDIGIKGIFLGSSKASLVTAVSLASRVLFGIEMERRRTTEFMSLLNYSFDVILKLNADCSIQTANYMAEKTFRKSAHELKGMRIHDLLEIPEDSPLASAISMNRNAYSIIVRSKRNAFVANIASIVVEGVSEGYILSMQEFERIDELEETVRSDRVNRAHTAAATFGSVQTRSARMRMACEEAIQYAQYDLPVLISGVFGTNKAEMAQCIHNASMRRKNPFVSVNLSGFNAQMQIERFAGVRGEQGRKGVFELAHTGTLFIEHIDLLAPDAQFLLLNVINDGMLLRMDGRPALPVNVRVLCSTTRELCDFVRNGTFLEALFCRLSQLEIRVPTLRERVEDMPTLIESCLERYGKQYRKHVTIAPEAQALIHAHVWEGDALQLTLFLEKIVILAADKHVDEAFISRHLPVVRGDGSAETAKLPRVPPVVHSREEEALLDMLEKHEGNRAATARAMGISTSTLWRKMKKYAITQIYTKDENR